MRHWPVPYTVGLVLATTALLRRTRERFPYSWGLVLTWGGLRGALPTVLALSLPPGFAHRELIVSMTLGVVALSILIHGLTMSPLLRLLGIVHEPQERRAHELARGRARAIRAALAELDRIQGASPIANEMLASLHQDYQARLDQTYEEIRRIHLKREEIRREELQRVHHHLILVEKHQLVEALREGDISRDVYEDLLADADARLLELDSQETVPPRPAS
ncbi:MAG: cation:proton antiporter [Planctomycetes bacterium]|nr:cation:proton antiporter [Planctomycetota bacterium]